MSHAVLSASSAHRWMNCPPSARLALQYPDKSSTYADEGTAAHALAENRLGEMLDLMGIPCEWSHDTAPDSTYHGPTMDDYVDGYVMDVVQRITALPEPHVMLEQRLRFDGYVPHGYGTGDVVILSEPVLEVIDLKYGRGVAISAERNPQLMLYGLGALEAVGAFYDIQTVRITVMQPRLESTSTYEIPADELRAWGRETVAPLAKLAWEGGGEYTAGDWCRFCPAAGTCKTRAETFTEYARTQFTAIPEELSPEEIGDILTHLIAWKAWVKDLETYAQTQAAQCGVEFPGWKLVEGQSRRKYKDEDAVLARLTELGHDPDEIAPRQVLGITAMEGRLKRKGFQELLGDLVQRTPGKLTLVPESDKRPAVDPGAVFTDITAQLEEQS